MVPPSQPVTVKIAVSPEQIVGLSTVITGSAFTVTEATAVLIQSPTVHVAVYVVEVVKAGVVAVVPVRPFVQVIVPPAQPVTSNVAVSPAQISGLFTEMAGAETTVTTAVLLQPPSEQVAI